MPYNPLAYSRINTGRAIGNLRSSGCPFQQKKYYNDSFFCYTLRRAKHTPNRNHRQRAKVRIRRVTTVIRRGDIPGLKKNNSIEQVQEDNDTSRTLGPSLVRDLKK